MPAANLLRMNLVRLGRAVVLLCGSPWAEDESLDFSFVTCMLLVGVKLSSTVAQMASKMRPVEIPEFDSTGFNDSFKSHPGG